MNFLLNCIFMIDVLFQLINSQSVSVQMQNVCKFLVRNFDCFVTTLHRGIVCRQLCMFVSSRFYVLYLLFLYSSLKICMQISKMSGGECGGPLCEPHRLPGIPCPIQKRLRCSQDYLSACALQLWSVLAIAVMEVDLQVLSPGLGHCKLVLSVSVNNITVLRRTDYSVKFDYKLK